MTILNLIGAELRRLLATPLARLAFVALMIVPLIYGGLYLWANRDPYSALDRVPAALVVEDTGTTVDGEAVDYGADIASTVVDGGDFDWTQTSAEDAAAGVRSGDYDFSITLPADFSRDLASASTDDPTQARVVLTTSDTNSYLTSTIAGQAAQTIRTQIAEQVGEEAADRFLVGFATIREDLGTALNGATRLADGLNQSAAGASTLADGTVALSDGAAQLAGGLDALDDATAGLPASANQLSSGAAQVAAGNAELATRGSAVAAASAQAAARVPQARADLVALLDATDLTADQKAEILAAVDPIGTDVETANAAIQTVNGQLGALAAGSTAVAQGARQLAAQAPALADGIGSAASGADDLASGAASARDGAAQLSTGTAQLATGAAELRDGLSSGLSAIPDADDATRTAQASTIGDPVDLATDDLAKATDYGAGLAPFFLSLAAWIGLYALFLIIKPLSRRAITALTAPWKVTLAGWLTPGLLGVVQSAMLVTLAGAVLGFGIVEPLGMFGFAALVSLTFAAILLALNALLGSVGQFIGLVLMVVQLVTAGGTFPWQTLLEPLAWLHRLLPMSYSVDGFRHLMYGGSTGAVVGDIAVLLGWLLVSLLATYLTASRMTRFRTLRDLRPSLIG
ncbi:YhgE/Pip family protein [Herbiconiux sp. L3-i23]|uniref:YhgE/Pip family protein n=1 Tax=Herbiconiux sp. L3-i23 TaxID=2905871 RepID=UPI0020705E0B|nr:YhgE/Pip domain-containing protein [Herbiconiux sp. L3-i23]BDI24094.1 ABC transporter [Herbiconiux sp. L3-i23]